MWTFVHSLYEKDCMGSGVMESCVESRMDICTERCMKHFTDMCMWKAVCKFVQKKDHKFGLKFV